MPRVSNQPGVTPSTGTTGTTGTSGTTPTGSGQPASDAAPAWSPPPLRSASGDIIPTKRVEISGLKGGTMNATGTTNRFSRDASFDAYQAPGDKAVASLSLHVVARRRGAAATRTLRKQMSLSLSGREKDPHKVCVPAFVTHSD